MRHGPLMPPLLGLHLEQQLCFDVQREILVKKGSHNTIAVIINMIRITSKQSLYSKELLRNYNTKSQRGNEKQDFIFKQVNMGQFTTIKKNTKAEI